jgi:signal transduction histidine kinase
MVLSPLPVVASSLDGTDVLPPGTFATVHLLVLFAIMLTYVNHAPEPTSFMVKLIGISLVTLLIILGLISTTAMRAYREAYAQTRRAELQHIQTLIDIQRFQDLPPDVYYLAARRVEGLFAPTYQMVAARPGAPDAAALAAHDAFRRMGLLRTHFPTRYLALHEHPWLGLQGISALENDRARIDTLIMPEGVTSYRGGTSYPRDHILRYTFVRQDTRYEVGYSYPAYRTYLHQKSLPLLALFVGTTVGILVAFPHFFWVGLVAPLNRLLQGVGRVNSGDLDVNVPVTIEDEIGHLTHAFNRMVASLRGSEQQLRDLNLTLEARIAEQTRDLTTLYEISAIGSQVQNLDLLLRTSLEQTLAALHSETGAIYLIPRLTDQPADAPPPTLQLAIQAGFPASQAPPSRIETGGEGAIGWVIKHQQPLLISHADRALLQGASWLAPTLDKQSLLVAPLRAERRIVGLLLLARPTAFSFTTREISLVTSIADQIGVSARSERLRQKATQLAERERIARDLHDTVTQSLYGMVVLTEAGQVQIESLTLPQESRTLLERWLHTVGETARHAIKEMRLFIYELQPPALRDQGLVGALHQRLASVEGRANVKARLLADETLRLPPATERALYQIAREALNNALRHAHASSVTITWGREDKAALLEVWDDGCGFDVQAPSNPGMGLSNMRHRADAIGAEFKIISAPGGTRVRVRVPDVGHETKE